MERAAWTDERIDHLSHRVDLGFERMDRDIRDLRADLGGEIAELRMILLRFGGRMMIALSGVIIALIGVIAAVLTTG